MFDPDLFDDFKNTVGPYPIDSHIIVQDKYKGVVARVIERGNNSNRPIIKLLYNIPRSIITTATDQNNKTFITDTRFIARNFSEINLAENDKYEVVGLTPWKLDEFFQKILV